MTDSPQEDDARLIEELLPIGSALGVAFERLKEVNDKIRREMTRVEELAACVAGTALHVGRYTDRQYQYAVDEITRIDKVVLPELEALRIAALSTLIDAHYPISVHYR